MRSVMYLPPSGQKRRGFLKKGLLGGALLALGGVGALSLRKGPPRDLPHEGLKVLDAQEYAVMAALAARIIPDRPGFPTVEELGTAAAADAVLQKTDPSVQAEVKQLLRLFENAVTNALFGGRTRPFTALLPPAQDDVLREWRDSRLSVRRTGYQALRGLLLAAYYGDARTWAAVGYPGPVEVKAP